jgi:hypothetical protein
VTSTRGSHYGSGTLTDAQPRFLSTQAGTFPEERCGRSYRTSAYQPRTCVGFCADAAFDIQIRS